MKRIAYNKSDGCWVDSNGARNDVLLVPDETDYYCLVDELGLIFRCFNDPQSWDEPLGVVYNFNGKKVADIPALVHPNYRGLKSTYKSRVSWTQGCEDGGLIFVISCSVMQDFRAMLDLQTLEFTDFAFGVW